MITQTNKEIIKSNNLIKDFFNLCGISYINPCESLHYNPYIFTIEHCEDDCRKITNTAIDICDIIFIASSYIPQRSFLPNLFHVGDKPVYNRANVYTEDEILLYRSKEFAGNTDIYGEPFTIIKLDKKIKKRKTKNRISFDKI